MAKLRIGSSVRHIVLVEGTQRACLLNAGLSAPSAHGQVTDAAPRIGVFIFPDGRADGTQ